jgi:hypothetical protein
MKIKIITCLWFLLVVISTCNESFITLLEKEKEVVRLENQSKRKITPPLIISAKTLDKNKNGKIDYYRLEFVF